MMMKISWKQALLAAPLLTITALGAGSSVASADDIAGSTVAFLRAIVKELEQ